MIRQRLRAAFGGQEGDGDFARFDCPRCGSFALSGTAELVTVGPDRKKVIAALGNSAFASCRGC
jgi:hypothetical protein